MHDLLSIPVSIVNGNSGAADKLAYLARGVFWAVSRRIGLSFIVRLWNGARIKVFPNSSFSPMFYFKYPEGADMQFFRANSSLANTFVDVGANVGIFSALMADKFSNVIMFEPSSDSFHSLEIMSGLNGQMAKFELHNIAVSDLPGSVKFIDEGAMSSGNRITNDENFTGAGVVVVRADTLDNVLAGRFDKIVMKVDIEGGEERAFNGAYNLFANNCIRLVMFERLGRTNLQGIEKFLSTHKYKVFRVLDNGVLSVDHDEISVPLINLFACPENIFSQLNTEF